MVDAEIRSPDPDRRKDIGRLIATIWLRNGGRWTNRYYDDMAWLGLALWRAGQVGIPRPAALEVLAHRLRAGWTDHGGGGIWWRANDDMKGVPSNGPSAILFTWLAADGHRADLQRALSIVDWMEEWLIDQDSGLVFDGLRIGPNGDVRALVEDVFTYNQGTFIGACVELACATGSRFWAELARRTVLAVREHLTGETGVLPGGSGDGGLFAGILARYLARAALLLDDADAARIVYLSAASAWRNRASAHGGPVFASDWTTPAVTGTQQDLSVQLLGWMLMEAAAVLEQHNVRPR